MRRETRVIAVSALLSSSFIILHSSFAAAPADALVADPGRSVGVTWPKHVINGRDYWLMLTPGFLKLKGLENEPFVVDSGTALVMMTYDVKRANPWGYASEEDRYTVGDISGDAALKARLKRAPFEIWGPIQDESVMKDRNVNRRGYDRLIAEYGDTFLGVRFNEWDAGILHRLGRYTSTGYKWFQTIANLPCDRAEMRENFRRHWELARVRYGRRMFGLSGEANFEHWGCEWGGSVSCVELQSEIPNFPFRNAIMFTRSAARQFDVPMCVYTAYYRAQYHPDSLPDHYGPEAGREVSLSWREHLLTYYMGNNLQNFESQPYGQVRRDAEGNHTLTANGLEIQRLYAWTRSPKGVRGECYTPILLLMDRAHGFDQLSGVPMAEDVGSWHFGPFMGSYQPNDADFYTSYAMQAIAPIYHPLANDPVPDKSACLRNSPLGDIYDVYIANSDVKGRELRDDQLAKYAVVMALGDIVWNNQLVNRIRKYVYEGGTFVATATQAQPFNEELGIKNDELRKNSPSFLIPHSSFLTNTVVSSFGRGNFITVTNDWMRQTKNRWKAPQQMKDLMQRLHDEVVPFKITGECEFLYNRMPDGSWKAIIMNNAGTAKKGNEPNTPPDPKWTRTVTLELPENAEVEEVLEGLKPRVAEKKVGGENRWTKEKLVSFDVLSGQVIVVNVKGLVKPAKTTSVQQQVAPLTPSAFPDQLYKPHPVYDKLLKNPDEHRYTKTAPALFLDWKNPTDGAQAVTTNVFIDAKYEIPVLTVTAEAKPDLVETAKPKGNHEGPVFYAASMLGIAIDGQGRWYAYAKYGYTNYRVTGPKATGDWQKLMLAFEKGTARFFVDGVEYKDPEKGRLTFPQKECRDGFYERLELDIGEQEHGWNNYFPGVIRSLRATSEVVPDPEDEKK